MSITVKICGVKDVDTARAAADLGAEFLGVVLTPSRRQVPIDHARAMIGTLPQTRFVAVAQNPDEMLFEAMLQLPVWGVQIHGNGPHGWARRAQRCGRRAIAAQWDPDADVILLDNASPGIGQPRDWSVPKVGKPVWLAGGLSPDNVADVVRRLAPAGVDVSTGVERDGVKSVELIRRFIEEVHHGES